MTEHKQTPFARPPTHPGRERHDDEQRPAGPRFHGDAWETAAENEPDEPSFDDEAPPATPKAPPTTRRR